MIDGTRHERKTQDYFPVGTRFRPLRDQILVKVLPVKLSKTIEAYSNGFYARGEIIAVGPGKFPNIFQSGKRDGKDFRTRRESTCFRPTEVKVGQIVHLGGGYIWPKIYIGHDEHILAMEADICGIEL